MTMQEKHNIDNHFTYHKPNKEQIKDYQSLRDKGKELAYLISNSVPDSKEKEISIAKLEECIMWANAGIARQKGEN